ncbi:hypothetical protein NM688_g5436 [Phlebia brevispora]|uniref:Uncharacterized protein n=1 Tax=Phlebia brevispora TaxID=194682 RepID=A0ACC1SVB4_9APHY|nr:hypothetical protein NM688_g5436 [Phlebia brevispora]
MHLLRAGDVVWDVAAGDEGECGEVALLHQDLDYTYSRVGDPPRYLPSLAFPPSYFHRIIRTMGSGNPIVRVDVSPWGEEVLSNIRLLQDKIRMETPQGGYHNVVRWVNRSSFTIRAPRGSKTIRLTMPHTAGAGPSPTGAWVIDPDWFGTVVVETEGTNEGREDLQERCRIQMMGGRGAEADENRTVWRILRERSRPGEIWIRAVSKKERLITA